MNILTSIASLFHNSALKYGYANARTKAMKGLLLSPQFYDELIGLKTVESMIASLEKSIYKDWFVKYSQQYSGVKLVEFATARHFGEVGNKIISIVPKDDMPLVQAILRRWDVTNINIIIASKKIGKSPEEIMSAIFPVGTLTEKELYKIASAPPNRILAVLKETETGRAFFEQSLKFIRGSELEQMFLEATKKAEVLIQLRVILYTYLFYGSFEIPILSKDKDAQRLMRILKKEIDFKNLVSILRLKEANYDAEAIKTHLIYSGTLRKEKLERLVETKSIDESVDMAGQWIGARKELEEYKKTRDLVDLEISLEKSIAKEKVSAFYRSVLSIGAPIGFLFIKGEEVNNIRKIATSKEHYLHPEEIRKTLIMV